MTARLSLGFARGAPRIKVIAAPAEDRREWFDQTPTCRSELPADAGTGAFPQDDLLNEPLPLKRSERLPQDLELDTLDLRSDLVLATWTGLEGAHDGEDPLSTHDGERPFERDRPQPSVDLSRPRARSTDVLTPRAESVRAAVAVGSAASRHLVSPLATECERQAGYS